MNLVKTSPPYALATLLNSISRILKGRLTLLIPDPVEIPPEKKANEGQDDTEDLHWHWEIFIPLVDDLPYVVNHTNLIARPRTAMICDRWTPHRLSPEATYKNPAHLIIHGHETVWCNIPPDCVNIDRRQADGLWVTMPLELSVFFHTRWTAFHESPLPRKKAAETLLRRPIELVLEEYLRLVSGHSAFRTNEAPASTITLVKGRIESLNGVGCSLAEMSKFVGYSPFSLAHLFKSKTGMSIGEYRDKVRGEYVCRAQVLGLKTKEIAAGLGFSSASAYLNWKSSRPTYQMDEDQTPSG